MKRDDNFFIPEDDIPSAEKSFASLGTSLRFEFPDKGMAAFGTEEDIFPSGENGDPVRSRRRKRGIRKPFKKGIRFISEPFRVRSGHAAEFTDQSGNIFCITDYIDKGGLKIVFSKPRLEANTDEITAFILLKKGKRVIQSAHTSIRRMK